MPSVLDEQTQYVDSAGKPLVSGKVYFGVQGADPTVSPITIYSDRALTVVLANPQILDANGRTANKVWVPGRYSIRVDDLNDAQKYQELDNGESADKGVTALENVSGGNTIVATAASTITAYEDLEQYTFRTAQVNTAAITLNIDTVGAKSIVKNHNQPVLPGEFEADQNIVVTYNLTDDVFEWVNQNNKVVDFYTGANVATATQPDVWVTGGNTFHFTGTTTVVDLADAPNIGARRTAIADGAFTLTHGSGITLEGSANLSISAGDRIEIYADAVDAFHAWVTRADGQSTVPPVIVNITLGTPVAATSGTAIDFTAIPAGTKRVTINFSGVSLSATSDLLIQLGDVGGVEATGYLGSGSNFQAGVGTSNYTTGLGLRNTDGTYTSHGTVTLELLDASTFTWAMSGNLGQAGVAQNQISGSSKSLSAELDRVSITTTGGTATFDAGKINITYEG